MIRRARNPKQYNIESNQTQNVSTFQYQQFCGIVVCIWLLTLLIVVGGVVVKWERKVIEKCRTLGKNESFAWHRTTSITANRFGSSTPLPSLTPFQFVRVSGLFCFFFSLYRIVIQTHQGQGQCKWHKMVFVDSEYPWENKTKTKRTNINTYATFVFVYL